MADNNENNNNDVLPLPRENHFHPPLLIQTEEDVMLAVAKKFVENEVFMPLRFAAFIVTWFWICMLPYPLLGLRIPLSLFVILTITFTYLHLRSMKDVRRPRLLAVPIDLLDIRLLEILLFYARSFGLDILTWLMMQKGSIHFHDVNTFGADMGKVSSFSALAKASNQIFWTVVVHICTLRLVVKLVLMCRTPSFRFILRYETKTIIVALIMILGGVGVFNCVTSRLVVGRSQTMAAFLLATLLIWTLVTLKTVIVTTKEEPLIARTNDVIGVNKIMTARLTQFLVSSVMEAQLHQVWNASLKGFGLIRYFSNQVGWMAEVGMYYRYGGRIPSDKGVIGVNMDLVFEVISFIMLAKMLRHNRDMNELQKLANRERW